MGSDPQSHLQHQYDSDRREFEANRPKLFQLGDFTLHSGDRSSWIINCEALSDDDLEALAVMALPLISPFYQAVGIPRGGLRFAAALKQHASGAVEDQLLIVDDVFTTGQSIRKEAAKYPINRLIRGLVIFARNPCPSWVTPIFAMSR